MTSKIRACVFSWVKGKGYKSYCFYTLFDKMKVLFQLKALRRGEKITHMPLLYKEYFYNVTYFLESFAAYALSMIF